MGYLIQHRVDRSFLYRCVPHVSAWWGPQFRLAQMFLTTGEAQSLIDRQGLSDVTDLRIVEVTEPAAVSA